MHFKIIILIYFLSFFHKDFLFSKPILCFVSDRFQSEYYFLNRKVVEKNAQLSNARQQPEKKTSGLLVLWNMLEKTWSLFLPHHQQKQQQRMYSQLKMGNEDGKKSHLYFSLPHQPQSSWHTETQKKLIYLCKAVHFHQFIDLKNHIEKKWNNWGKKWWWNWPLHRI